LTPAVNARRNNADKGGPKRQKDENGFNALSPELVLSIFVRLPATALATVPGDGPFVKNGDIPN
jgi:hypothetical protein